MWNSAYHLARFKINSREEADRALGEGGRVQEHSPELKTQAGNVSVAGGAAECYTAVKRPTDSSS